jgi:hypothetical protein
MIGTGKNWFPRHSLQTLKALLLLFMQAACQNSDMFTTKAEIKCQIKLQACFSFVLTTLASDEVKCHRIFMLHAHITAKLNCASHTRVI